MNSSVWRPEVDFLRIPQSLSPPYFLRQGLLLNQELAVMAKQATCLPLLSSLPPPHEVQAHITVPIFSVGAGNLNSGSSACIANTLPTEQSST